MHRLHLLRHAKSNPDDNIEDRQRRLNRRGRDAARRVGESLPAALGAVDLVLCSTALRTRETAELVFAGFAPSPRILFDDELYLAVPSQALDGTLAKLDSILSANSQLEAFHRRRAAALA